MTKYKFGGVDSDGIYLDETILRMSASHRRIFSLLIAQLLKEGKKDKALKALEYCEKVLPGKNIPHSYQSGSVDLAKAWLLVDKKNEANAILEEVGKNASEYCRYFLSLDASHLAASDFQFYLSVLHQCANNLKYGASPKSEEYSKLVDTYYNAYQIRFGGGTGSTTWETEEEDNLEETAAVDTVE